jgi:hypothetical protein
VNIVHVHYRASDGEIFGHENSLSPDKQPGLEFASLNVPDGQHLIPDPMLHKIDIMTLNLVDKSEAEQMLLRNPPQLPMPLLKVAAIARVNEHFNRRAHELMHIDHAHAGKRRVAAAIMAGEPISEDHPFVQEASLREMNVSDFAQVIVNKPDNIARRELQRQQAIMKIESATTPDDLDAITSNIG